MLLLAFICWKQRADVGQRRFFRNQTYHFQTLRVFNDIPAGGADTGEIIVQAIGKPIPERVFCCVRDPSTPFARFLQRAERLGQRWNIPVDSLTSILSTKIWTDFDPNEALQREFRPRR